VPDSKEGEVTAPASVSQQNDPSNDSAAAIASIETLSALCAAAPDRAEPRVALALALLQASRAAEAFAPAEQAVALAPQLAAAHQARDAVVAALQAGEPALVAMELAAVLEPENASAQLTVGEAYAALGRAQDAERSFKRALALGKAAEAHADLAALYLSVGMLEAAEHHAQSVLSGPDRGAADDTVFAMANQTLAGVLEARGDHAGGEMRLDRAYGRQSLFRQPAPGAAFTTLVLVTRRAGNVPYESLLPAHRYDRAVWYMEHARAEQGDGLPDYALVLNAIGDADIAMDSYPSVAAFLGRNKRPVLNPPERVAATFRSRLAETLAGIADVFAPRTVRLASADIAAKGLAGAVAAAGMRPPVLARPVGLHGGAGLALALDAAGLAAVDLTNAGDVYVTAFVDYRSPDGFYRKYRVIYVDRKAFPYHLAISRNWMVHHRSSEMADDPVRKSEELAFLRDPAAAIGARAKAAIEAIGRRLDLDYGGIDFGLTADGQVLVFEANATMLTHLEAEDGPFAAKNPFVRPIIDAFQAHLEAVAASASA
jgi:tetratricopeptide (TPR) repeat protein